MFYLGFVMVMWVMMVVVGCVVRLVGARTTRDDAREECAAGAAAVVINVYVFVWSVEVMYVLLM